MFSFGWTRFFSSGHGEKFSPPVYFSSLPVLQTERLILREYEQSDYDALYPIRENGLWGYMNRTGETVIAPQWEYADSFFSTGSQWLAPVYKTSDSKIVWQGFINEKNELIGERAVSDAESVRILHELLDSAK